MANYWLDVSLLLFLVSRLCPPPPRRRFFFFFFSLTLFPVVLTDAEILRHKMLDAILATAAGRVNKKYPGPGAGAGGRREIDPLNLCVVGACVSVSSVVTLAGSHLATFPLYFSLSSSRHLLSVMSLPCCRFRPLSPLAFERKRKLGGERHKDNDFASRSVVHLLQTGPMRVSIPERNCIGMNPIE